MPAFLDHTYRNAEAVIQFLNYLSANLTALLRTGTMSEAQLDQIIDLIKESASGPDTSIFQHYLK